MFTKLPIELENFIYKIYFSNSVLDQIKYQPYKKVLTFQGYLFLSKAIHPLEI